MAEPFLLGIILFVTGLILFVVELSTPGFFVAVPATVLFVFGTIVLLYPEIFENWWAIPIVVIVSIASLMVTMKAYEKLAPPDKPAYGAIEALINSEGHVIKTIEPNSLSGKVSINHREWAATASKRISVGTKVRVLKGEGVHLEVREASDFTTSKKSNE